MDPETVPLAGLGRGKFPPCKFVSIQLLSDVPERLAAQQNLHYQRVSERSIGNVVFVLPF